MKTMVRMLVIALLSVVCLAHADSIKLLNGKEYVGKIVVKGEHVTVVNDDGVFQFKKQEIDEMNGKKLEPARNPVLRIATSKGDMLVELYEDEVPNTVANIITLAESGFYKGMSFHRVIDGFMAQGGCPHSKRDAQGRPGTGGPGYSFADEFSPKLRHSGRGILSMANSGPNSNGSQFFLCFTATPHLDDRHAVFGKVIEGLEVLDRLEKIGSSSGTPKEDVRFNIEVVSKRDHAYQVKKQ
jgi:cyclophilin family peptidyl-prolyl cis-trans isomerase